MSFLRIVLLLILISLLITACGGGSTGNNAKTGIILDSPIEGLQYSTASHAGATNQNGEFQYQEGELIKFSLGEILIGESKADKIITPLSFIKSNDHPDTLTNILQLLQTLDSDNDPENGIRISKSIQNDAKNLKLDFSSSQEEFVKNREILEFLAKNGKNSGLVDPDKATIHFHTTLAQQNIQLDLLKELYSVGGIVSGLSGQLTLSNHGIDAITLNNDNSFVFNTPLPDNTNYQISIQQQPENQTCSIINGEGIVKSANVSSISVTCVSHSNNLNGQISGLSGSLILSTDNRRYFITDNGNYNIIGDFPSSNIKIDQQPDDQICTLESNSINASLQYNIHCIDASVKLGGSIQGLHNPITISNSDGSLLYIAENGNFEFDREYSIDATYNTSIVKQPDGQNCQIEDSAGQYSTESYYAISISCKSKTYDLNIVLNGAADGNFPIYINDVPAVEVEPGIFSSQISYYSDYAISYVEPVTQKCSLVGGDSSGLMPASDLNLSLDCLDIEFKFNISTNNFLSNYTLLSPGINDILIDKQFITKKVEYGTNYNFSLSEQPKGLTCTIENESGTVSSTITNIVVNCQGEKHTALVSITNLKSPITIKNETTGQTFTGENPQYSFEVEYGQQYDIGIVEHPEGQTCTINNGTGQVGTVDIDNIGINCVGTPYVLDVNIDNLHGELTLSNNGNPPIFSSKTNVRFDLRLGENYSISIEGDQPKGQICSFTSSIGGTVNSTTIEPITVGCDDQEYFVRLNLENLRDTSITVSNNQNESPFNTIDLGNNNYQYVFKSKHYALYEVQIDTQPEGQNCQFSTSNKDRINGEDVIVDAKCTNSIGRVNLAISGLNGALQIENLNLPDSIKNTTFNGPISVDATYYENYNLELTSPVGQTCTFDNTKRTISDVLVPEDTSTLAVSCSDNIYTVLVTVNNLRDNTLQISNNNIVASPISTTIENQYTFNFTSTYQEGYDLQISTNSSKQSCNFQAIDILKAITIQNNVSLSFTCENNIPAVLPIQIDNLKGTLELLETESNSTISLVGQATTTNSIVYKEHQTQFYTNYNFSSIVVNNPTGQSCTVVSGETGHISNNNPTPLLVQCSDTQYDSVISISNVDFPLHLIKNDVDLGDISALSSYTAGMANGDLYKFEISNPSLTKQQCKLYLNGTVVTKVEGTISGGPITGISISCENLYSVSATVNGLQTTSENQQLMVSGDWSNDLLFTPADSTLGFSTSLVHGSIATLTLTNPSQHTCVFSTSQSRILIVDPVISDIDVTIDCLTTVYSIGGNIINGSFIAGDVQLGISGITDRVNLDSTTGSYQTLPFLGVNDTTTLTLHNNSTSQHCEFSDNTTQISYTLSTADNISNADINCYDTQAISFIVSGVDISTFGENPVSLSLSVRDHANNPFASEIINITDFGTILSDAYAVDFSYDVSLNANAIGPSRNCYLSAPIANARISSDIVTNTVSVTCFPERIVDSNYLSELSIDTQLQSCILDSVSTLEFPYISDVTALNCTASSNDLLLLDNIDIFQNLNSLTLSQFLIADLQILRNIPALDTADAVNLISNNYLSLSDASYLPTHVNDKLLSCIRNQYSLTPDITLDQIQSVTCDNVGAANSSKIDSLNGIELLHNLRVANLPGNAIWDIKPLSKLNILSNALPSKLQQLLLSENDIQILEYPNVNPNLSLGLYQLRSLNILDLRVNPITAYSSLATVYTAATDITPAEYFLNNIKVLDLITNDQYNNSQPNVYLDMDSIDDLYALSTTHDSSQGITVDNDIRLAPQNHSNPDQIDLNSNGVFDRPIDVAGTTAIFERLSVTFRFRPYNSTYKFSLVAPDGTEVVIDDNYNRNNSAHFEPVYNASEFIDAELLYSLLGNSVNAQTWIFRIEVTNFTAVSSNAHIDEVTLTY